MDVLTAILTRRSVRRFQPRPVEQEKLAQILAAAVRAPNHGLTEPWHFYVLRGSALQRLAQLRADHLAARGETDPARIARQVQEIASVPALIIVASHRGRDEIQTRENYAASCCAVQNMLLAAHGLGLGAMWRTGRFLESPALRHFLGAPDSADLVAQVYLGYPDEARETPRTDWRQKTTWL